ncbi:MAG: phenylalanine--tRNA ligase subunit alpha [Candidatus Kerfeldbacteria bacterium]
MKKKIEHLLEEFTKDIKRASSPEEVEKVRVEYLGRKAGKLNAILRMLKDLPIEDKREISPLANNAKKKMEQELDSAEKASKGAVVTETDITLPGLPLEQGHIHPISQINTLLMDIFRSMGYMIYEGPELESDYYNFEALNFPPGHPARDIQDTFFVKDAITRKERRQLDNTKWLMRTHTSNMQVRIMEQNEPPLRCIIPGRTFRNEATDASHEHTFYQLEGFVVDENITIGHLKWTMQELFRQLFGSDIKVRLRPGYFPFTEPSYEPEVSCPFCGQKGCSVCKHTGWIEVAGSGMINQNVFKAAGYEERKYTGFAFGFGLTRLAMLLYGIPDIRMFMQNDIRFLEQF